jgi:hypothetical protein
MRPLPTLSLLAALVLAGCAIIVTPNEGDVHLKTVFSKDAVLGDGRVTSERREVEGLPELAISGPLLVEVRVGEARSLQVEADGNLLPLIRTQAEGEILKIWVEGEVRTNNGMRVLYTVPQLSKVKASGSGRLTVSGLQGGALTLNKSGSGDSKLSGRVGTLNMQLTGSGDVDAAALRSGNANLSLTGSGRLKLGQVSADALNIKLRGSGELEASGSVAQLNAQVVGSGGANLKELASQRADLSTTGSGDISARVTQSLVAQTTGSGRITVYGNPAQRNISGRHVKVVE